MESVKLTQMATIMEEKILSLERELKGLQTTVMRYENRLRDQKLFCDCVAKFFLHKFGFDIWIQLDMLKSSLEDAGAGTSDSDDPSIFPKRISNALSIAKKRRIMIKNENRLKSNTTPVPAATVGEATSSGMPIAISRVSLNRSREFEKNSSPVLPSPAIVDVESSDASEASRFHQAEYPSTSMGGNPGNLRSGPSSSHHHLMVQDAEDFDPRAFVKCESDYYDGSNDVSINWEEDDIGPDDILITGVEGFGTAPNQQFFSNLSNRRMGSSESKRNRRRDRVWSYFHIYPQSLLCKIPECKTPELKGVVTTNAKKHIQNHHPEVWHQILFEEQMMASRLATGIHIPNANVL